jgi:hypothetical protein
MSSEPTERCCKGRDYAVFRIIPSKGDVDFCGTVYAEDLTSAEAVARLLYPVSGGDRLEVEEDQP